MSTLTIAVKDGRVALAAESLTTFDEMRLPPENDAAPEKAFAIETVGGTAYVGVVGYAAHHLVLRDALGRLDGLDLGSRKAVFDTFQDLHPVLKEDYYLLPDSGQEGDPYESSQMSVLIASPGGAFGVFDMREVHAYRRFWAMGSGGAYALGAMWHAYGGAADAASVARLGVEAGCAFDRSSAAPVEVWEAELRGEAPA